ncbi:MAG: hypothetical protein L3J23_08685 [Flavobacteriaceae bacterium]|nr:hypothetical protein [Flavobacteriaceae bacterium]
MKELRNILNFYIFSNIHVALASFCLTKITLLEIGISENITALFVFFSTLVSYNFIRFLKSEKEINWFQEWSQIAKSNLRILTVAGLLFIIYFTFQLRLKAILVLFPFLIFTIFYVFPMQKYAIRNIAGLKLFLIAISWAGVTVLFPLVQNFIIPRAVDYIIFLQRFLFVAVITIPFDIRDLDMDSEKLKTLPQQFGIKKSKFIGLLFLVLFLVLIFFKSTFCLNSILILVIIAIISGLFLMKSTAKQHKYYSAFFVESIPIIWLVLILFFT